MNEPLDNATQTVAPSEAVAPPNGGEAPAATPASADTAVPGEPDKEQPPAEPKRDRKVEKRISRLTQRLDAANQEVGYWRGVAEARTQQPPAEPTQGEPQRRSAPENPAERADADLSRSVIERVQEAGKDIEDFDEVMETITAPSFPISRTMRDFMGEADHPAQIAQWLAENPDEARRISQLSDAVAVRALERRDAGFKVAKPAPKTSNAPPPVPTVGGRSTPSFDPNTASMEEYAAHWQARQAKR